MKNHSRAARRGIQLGTTALVVAMLGSIAGTASAQIPEPEFTPMTVRPQLTNQDEVRQALMREYPAVLRDAGIEAAPEVWIHIDESGAVDATRIHEGSGFEGLDEAAMNVARAMRFSPAENLGAVVAVWVRLPIRFAVVR